MDVETITLDPGYYCPFQVQIQNFRDPILQLKLDYDDIWITQRPPSGITIPFYGGRIWSVPLGAAIIGQASFILIGDSHLVGLIVNSFEPHFVLFEIKSPLNNIKHVYRSYPELRTYLVNDRCIIMSRYRHVGLHPDWFQTQRDWIPVFKTRKIIISFMIQNEEMDENVIEGRSRGLNRGQLSVSGQVLCRASNYDCLTIHRNFAHNVNIKTNLILHNDCFVHQYGVSDLLTMQKRIVKFIQGRLVIEHDKQGLWKPSCHASLCDKVRDEIDNLLICHLDPKSWLSEVPLELLFLLIQYYVGEKLDYTLVDH